MGKAERAFPFSLLHHHSCAHVTRTPFGHMTQVRKRTQQNKPLSQKMLPNFLTLIFYLGIRLVWFNLFHMSPSNSKNGHTHINCCFNYIEETQLIKICNFYASNVWFFNKEPCTDLVYFITCYVTITSFTILSIIT